MCFRCILQVFYLDVAYVSCICYKFMFSNVLIVLDVYCICFMLSVSCFGGTLRGAHGFLRA
jgi:hypothetical protein